MNHAVHVADLVVLAFDVGGTSIKASAFDGSLTELATTVRRSPQGPAVLDAIVECADDLLAALTDEVRGRAASTGWTSGWRSCWRASTRAISPSAARCIRGLDAS